MKPRRISPSSVISLLFICFSVLTPALSQRCRPGSFRNADSCSPCPVATFQSRFEADSCLPCPAGTTTVSTGSQGRDLCLPCPADTFSAPGSGCQSCPPETQSRPGATSVEQCLKCGPGTMLSINGMQCVTCPPATFSSANLNNECTPCPTDTFAPEGSTTIQDCTNTTASMCPPGSDFRRNMCRRCSPGTFKPDNSSSMCRGCPMGTISERGAVQCTPCPPGRFSRFSNECERCVRGTTSLGTGSTICRRINGPCPPDAIENASGACVRCEDGRHRINLETGMCEACPPGLIAAENNATECKRCPAGMVDGFFQCECIGGTIMTESGSCEPCPPGTAGSFTSCSPCEVGFVAPRSGMSECERCPDNLIPSEDGTKCIACPPGTSTNIGPRDLFFFSFSLQNIDSCRDEQTGCPVGFNREGEFGPAICVPRICRRSTPPNQTCRRCRPGARPRSDPFRTFVCDDCNFNFFSDGLTCRRCPNGMSRDPEDGSKCACGEGRGMQGGACRLCPAGTFSGRLDQECLKCEPGSFNARGGSDFCELCPIDSFVDSSGAAHCERCPPGTFTYDQGQTRCLSFLV